MSNTRVMFGRYGLENISFFNFATKEDLLTLEAVRFVRGQLMDRRWASGFDLSWNFGVWNVKFGREKC